VSRSVAQTWTAPTSTAPFTTVTGRATRAWKAANLNRITLHEARHTAGSIWIFANVNIKAVSTFMGHASITITLDRYGHLLPGSETEAAALIDAYLDRATTSARLAQLDTAT
jgi:integrase